MFGVVEEGIQNENFIDLSINERVFGRICPSALALGDYEFHFLNDFCFM